VAAVRALDGAHLVLCAQNGDDRRHDEHQDHDDDAYHRAPLIHILIAS
jgi:hypothetical protein